MAEYDNNKNYLERWQKIKKDKVFKSALTRKTKFNLGLSKKIAACQKSYTKLEAAQPAQFLRGRETDPTVFDTMVETFKTKRVVAIRNIVATYRTILKELINYHNGEQDAYLSKKKKAGLGKSSTKEGLKHGTYAAKVLEAKDTLRDIYFNRSDYDGGNDGSMVKLMFGALKKKRKEVEDYKV